MRAAFLVPEALNQQRFHFRRDGMLQSLGFIMRFGPGKPDDVRQQHFRKLMA